MAAEKQIQLKQAGTGIIFTIPENDIIRVFANSTGSSVNYYNEGAMPQQIDVEETPAQVAALTSVLFVVTAIGAGSEYINANLVLLIDDASGTTVIKYHKFGAYPEFISVTQTKGAIQATIFTLAGGTPYAIDTVNLTPDAFTLAAAHGNVTAKFTNGDVFSVVNSTGNDGTYTVSSSSFGGGQTTVAVVEEISDNTADGSILVVS